MIPKIPILPKIPIILLIPMIAKCDKINEVKICDEDEEDVTKV